jgi:NADH:ubiquinone oxidoreductase subunit 2 (subunit N)
MLNAAMSIAGMLYYLLVYTFMNMGVFAVVTLFVKRNGKGEKISGLDPRRITPFVLGF